MESVYVEAAALLQGIPGARHSADEAGRQREPAIARIGRAPHVSLQVEAPAGAASEGPQASRRRRLAGSPDRNAGGQDRSLGADRRRSVAGAGFFRECLAKDRKEGRDDRRWRECIYAEIRSRMRSQGGLSIQRMCELAGVSRASFYRHWEEREPAAAE